MKKLILLLCLLSTPVMAKELMSFDDCVKHQIDNNNVRQIIKDFDKIKHKFKCKDGGNWLEFDTIGWKNDISYNRTGFITGYYIKQMCINFKEADYLMTIFNPILDGECVEKGNRQWLINHKNSIRNFKKLIKQKE